MRSIETAAAMLRRGEVSSVELVRGALELADALDEALGAYLTRFDDAALAAAKQADADFAARVDRGPLQGIPVAVKDNLFAAEGPTTAQSTVCDPAWDITRDATAVARLKAAGAVLTGKLTRSEFAIGVPDMDSPYPRPRNPWDVGCWPGGSSSGTGAAVGAGLVFAGLGTDSAGSVRIPSAMCGLAGLKPTFGRVPVTGSIPLAESLDHIGPMARSVWDCAAMLRTVAGVDESDPSSLRVPVPDYLAELGRTRESVRLGVAVPAGWDGDHAVEAPVAAAFENALRVLRSLGLGLADVTLPEFDATVATTMLLLRVEMFALDEQTLRARWDDYSRSTRDRLAAGAFASGAELLLAQRQRVATRRQLEALFTDVDVVVSPMPIEAPRYGLDESLDRTAIGAAAQTVRYWNCVGYPALVIPMGTSPDGLPLSMQLVAAPRGEELLLWLGAAFQRVTDWHLREPTLAGLDDASAGIDPAAGISSTPAVDSEDAVTADALLWRAGIDPGDDRRALGAAYAAHRSDVAAIRASADRRASTGVDR